MASGSAPPVDHHREPCPDRILDDIGGAFSMGAIGGGLFHAGKQLIWGPKSFKMQGAVEVRLDSSAGTCALAPGEDAMHAIENSAVDLEIYSDVIARTFASI